MGLVFGICGRKHPAAGGARRNFRRHHSADDVLVGHRQRVSDPNIGEDYLVAKLWGGAGRARDQGSRAIPVRSPSDVCRLHRPACRISSGLSYALESGGLLCGADGSGRADFARRADTQRTASLPGILLSGPVQASARSILRSRATSEVSMREWLLVLLPVGLILYFVIFQDQFSAVMAGLGRIIFN